jgi:hypothetical protein
MIVVRISGGLGNQMFQYAFARKLASLGRKVYLEWSGSQHNGFELDSVFSKPLSSIIPMATATTAGRATSRLLRTFAKKREPKYIGLNIGFLDCRYAYLIGYWQTEKYFSDIASLIFSDFTFKSPNDDKTTAAIKYMRETPCACMHVRRGDYVGNTAVSGICDKNYYERAVRKIKDLHPDIPVIAFSDDFAYCRSELNDCIDVLVDWNGGLQSWQDMLLMSNCRHHIIANSTFSWWGAWLGTHDKQVVITPRAWFGTGAKECNNDIYPDRWIQI